MQTYKLLINGIDHSVFDIEWAKRGGVFVVTTNYNGDLLCGTTMGIVVCINNNGIKMFAGYTIEHITEQHRNPRMATPEECASASVKYVPKALVVECYACQATVLVIAISIAGDCCPECGVEIDLTEEPYNIDAIGTVDSLYRELSFVEVAAYFQTNGTLEGLEWLKDGDKWTTDHLDAVTAIRPKDRFRIKIGDAK